MSGLSITMPREQVRDCMLCGNPVLLPPKIAEKLREERKEPPAWCGDCEYKRATEEYDQYYTRAVTVMAKGDKQKVFEISIAGNKISESELEGRIRALIADRGKFPDKDWVRGFVEVGMTSSEKRVLAAIRYMYKHGSEALTVNNFADLCGVSV